MGRDKNVSAYGSRRVGVCKASSTPSRPLDHYNGVEKQSHFRKRRYANTPTRRYASPRTFGLTLQLKLWFIELLCAKFWRLKNTFRSRP